MGNGTSVTNDTGSTDDDSIEEHSQPTPGNPPVLQPRRPPRQHPDDTRMFLAYGLLAVLAGVVAAGCWGWIEYGDDPARMQSFGALFSPVVTLVGTVLAFYFFSSKPQS